VARHGIAPERVIGHSDVAPLRKEDPGERFDWRRLAAAGIGLWPEDIPKLYKVPSEATLRAQLARFGYDLEEVPLSSVITAFQRHFRQEQVSGIADLETASRLAGLLRLLEPART
jgi:N-acetylmuramoyl-L-alanine amidase